MRPKVLLLALLVTGGVATAVRAAKLQPIDEAAKVPGFAEFRKQLFETVRKRDAQALMRVVHPDIEMSFGIESGIKDFKKTWRPERRNSQLWTELEAVLRLGGKWEQANGKRSFWAPYVHSARWPKGPWDEPGSPYIAVTAKDVRVRARPNPDAPAIAALSYDIVKSTGKDVTAGGRRWTPIETPSSVKGYIAAEFAHHPWDYRAEFRQVNGRWMMTTFIAGD